MITDQRRQKEKNKIDFVITFDWRRIVYIEPVMEILDTSTKLRALTPKDDSFEVFSFSDREIL